MSAQLDFQSFVAAMADASRKVWMKMLHAE